MKYFANPSTPDVRNAMSSGSLSMIATPKQGQSIPAGAEWCADNGCFGKGYPGDEAWLAWLDTYTLEERRRCLFATAPDVVGDAEATIKRSLPWLPKIRALGYPAAFVGQDGLEDLEVPWDEFDVFFIGGSTEWKLGAAARSLVAEAKARGKRVHMGRVNSLKRLRYAAEIGCDTADGTYITFGPDRNFPRVLAWLEIVNRGLSTTVDALLKSKEAAVTTIIPLPVLPAPTPEILATLREAKALIDTDVKITPVEALPDMGDVTLFSFATMPTWPRDTIFIRPESTNDPEKVAAALRHWLAGGAPTYTAADILSLWMGCRVEEITDPFTLGNVDFALEEQARRVGSK